MPDTIEERLAQLGTSLEDAAGYGSPSLIRGRGEELRIAHRRRTVAMTSAAAVVATVGIASAFAFGSGGGSPQDPARPGPTGHSAPAPAPRVSGSVTAPPASAHASVVVDLRQHKMTVAKNGKTVRTILVTAGTTAHPTATGTFTVDDKVESEDGRSEGLGSDVYDLQISWVIKLGAPGRFICAMPWNQSRFGVTDGTHGGIGMSTADAQWLYANINVGDQIRVQ